MPQPADEPIIEYPPIDTKKPRRLRIKPLWPLLTGALSTIVVAGGASLTIVGSSMNRCMGATRSSRLQWQERQAEIDAQMQAESNRTSHERQ
jgi:hypothetical protein